MRSRPAYLQLHQVDADTYDVLWKVPAPGRGQRLALYVEFAPDTATVGKPRADLRQQRFPAALARAARTGGLDGTPIRIDGLQSTLTDVLVRLERLDGTTQTMRVTPAAPSFVIEAQPGRWQVARRPTCVLGIEHILLGIDHLLFVLAL